MILGPLITFSAFVVGAQSGRNLASRKPTFISSTWADHKADHCADGNDKDSPPPPNFGLTFCLWCTTHYGDRNPWWAVDLLRVYKVVSVHIILIIRYSKTQNLLIELFDHRHQIRRVHKDGNLCLKRKLPREHYFRLKCNPGATGRFVRLKKTDVIDVQDPLCMCEVFVYGRETTKTKEASPTGKKDNDGVVPPGKANRPVGKTSVKKNDEARQSEKTTNEARPPEKTTNEAWPSGKMIDEALIVDKGSKQLTPLFACKHKNGVQESGYMMRHCSCLCQIPLEDLPYKYKKVADDIRQKCINPV